MAHPPIYDDNLFSYTTGNWLVNDELRHAERRRDFDVAGLSQLAAKSVGRSPDDILRLEKLAEGGFNRTFLITMHDGFRMVARIPYPVTTPKYFAVASEVATLDRLRSAGLPVPDVYGYSPTPDNAARTEHIFMAFVEGINLDAIWYELEEKDIISISRQIAELEVKMMSIPFPAGGSLYFPEDLANAPGSVSGITLEDKRFCVGPDTHPHLWCGRRSELDVNRGPHESAGAALKSGPEKEVAFLRRFGRPLLPFQRARRDVYQYREQLPSHHIENLDLFSSIAPSLIPNDPTLVRFCMRHPDLQPSNIIVSWSRDANSYVVDSLIDWQHVDALVRMRTHELSVWTVPLATGTVHSLLHPSMSIYESPPLRIPHAFALFPPSSRSFPHVGTLSRSLSPPCRVNRANTICSASLYLPSAALVFTQHTLVLPLFLQAGIPNELQNHGDIVSRFMARPSLPDNFDNLDETEQREERERYRRRLVHYHYVDNTEKYNKVHSAALTDPAGVLRRRLFHHARSPWRGESLELKLALIRATEKWETLTGPGGSPCPIVFDPDDVRKTSELETELEKSDELLEKCRDLIGVGEDWMPAERYKAALAISQQLKVDALAATESAKERAEIEAHWPFDDRNEDDYM